MERRYFGTDGVRGVVGESLTLELVERLGRAVTLWSENKHVLVGRDTRDLGPALLEALTEGIVSAGGTAEDAGVLPTPAVALLSGEIGAVISASHNPPEYNGIKLFMRGQKLTDQQEVEIEALLDVPGTASGTWEARPGAAASYREIVLRRFGADLTGLRIAVDCANGAFSEIAPGVLESLGASVTTLAAAPDGSNINVGCGATDLALLRDTVRGGRFDLGVAFDGDGDRMLAVDERGEPLDGDQIIAVLALDLGVDQVAVTTMTNLGFHQLMSDHGIRVHVTDVGDRHVLEALRREGGMLGGEQSGHLIWLHDHVTGDGLVAALLLCTALRGKPLSQLAALMPRFPQVKEDVPVASAMLPRTVLAEADRVNSELGGRGRVLVRMSGTEPVVRVLAEAETEQEASVHCARIAKFVRQELGVV